LPGDAEGPVGATGSPGGGTEGFWKRLGRRFSDLLVRVVSAVVLVLVVLILLWWGELPFTIGMVLLSVAGMNEIYRAFHGKGYRPVVIPSLVAGGSLPLLAYYFQERESGFAWLTLAFSLYLPLLFLWALVRGNRRQVAEDLGLSLLGVMLVGFCLSHFVLMLGLDPERPWTAPFSVIVLVWVFDAVAYLAGTAFGNRKIVPSISPGKTWEGTLCAGAITFVAAYLIHRVLGREWLNLGTAMALAAITCLFAFLGDLSESVLKRELGIKDMGSLIPGHGGVMDRFDSMLMTAAVSYYFLRFLVFKL